MANRTCVGLVDVCAMRITRLLENGHVDYGTDNLYILDSIMSVAITDTITSSDDSMLKNGCGRKCVVKNGEDEPVSQQTLDAQFCKWDAEPFEMLTGHTLLTKTGDTIGLAYPDPTGPLPVGAVLEFWSKSYDGDTQVATNGFEWIRHCFPRAKATFGNRSLAEGAQAINLSIKCSPNSAVNLGPFADWPAVPLGPSLYFTDTAVPDALCGYDDISS